MSYHEKFGNKKNELGYSDNFKSDLNLLNSSEFINSGYTNIGTYFIFIFKNKIVEGIHVNDKNYKLSVYQLLVSHIIEFIIKYKDNDKLVEYIIENSDIFLSTLTHITKGHIYLHQLKSLIQKYKDKIELNSLINNAALKGTLPTFIFWISILDKSFNEYIFDNPTQCILASAIKNSDDRIYKWILKELEKNKNREEYFQLYIINILKSILKSQIPTKYILKRIRILSENYNIKPYFDIMVVNAKLEILSELFRFYYYEPISTTNLVSISDTFTSAMDDTRNNHIQKIYKLLKTENEKQILLLLILQVLLKDNNEQCCWFLSSLSEVNIKKECIYQIKNELGNNIIEILDMNEPINKLDLLFNKNCQCGKQCFSFLLKTLCKINFFHKISNAYTYLPIVLQLLTKFYSPNLSVVDVSNDVSYEMINFLKINKLLSFLRIIAKKKSKSKVINFQSNFFPVLQELVNFAPSNKLVLKKGSLNWQYKKNKFTNLPPRHLLPYEINIYDNFLLRLKADGILVNNLPISITPKFEEIVARQVKAEYIEELELYLIFDIDIPNTNIINRYEILRNNHKYTKNSYLVSIKNIDELIKEIEKEQIIFNKFLDDTKNDKIRWYPKVSFLIENCSMEFKQQLLEVEGNLISNYKIKYNCDGMILSPLMNNYNFRDIKIKPKEFMTIDLFFDGINWLDKDKNKYNNIILKTNTNTKSNKIYRCYPVNNLYEPREIRYDKKHANNSDIINMIRTVYNFDYKKSLNSLENPYYHLTKSQISERNFINILQDQTKILEKQIEELNPDSSKTWLDLGCGKGKLIYIIKKYNPKKYVGLDIDINILLTNLYKIDEHDWVKFNPCDLKGDWFDNIKWYSIQNMKFDYIVLNFSLMHLFDSDKFWSQLKSVCKSTTKILFNIVSENIKTQEFSMNNAYMKYKNDKIIYYFPWAHNKEVEENLISKDSLEKKLLEYNFKIGSISNPVDNTLSCMYDWYKIEA